MIIGTSGSRGKRRGYADSKCLQEAQLSQRDRATLRVIEYFAKSFKVTEGHSKWHCCVGRMYKSLLVFQWYYVCMSYSFWDIQRQRMTWPLNWSRSRSLKMVPFDRSHSHRTFYWSAIVNIALSCAVFLSYLTFNNIVTLKSGLEVTQDHSKWYHSKA